MERTPDYTRTITKPGKKGGGEGSGHLQSDGLGVRIREMLLHVEDLDANDLASIVEVEDDPGRDLLRVGDRCVIQPRSTRSSRSAIGANAWSRSGSSASGRRSWVASRLAGPTLSSKEMSRSRRTIDACFVSRKRLVRSIKRHAVRCRPWQEGGTPDPRAGVRGLRAVEPGRNRRGKGLSRWRRRGRGR